VSLILDVTKLVHAQIEVTHGACIH
jgi:hypothetical protein